MPRPRFTRDAKHFVVASSFTWLDREFQEGEVFPWEELDVSPIQLRDLWVANKINVAPAPPANGPEQSSPVEFKATPGEHIAVSPPKRKRDRAATGA